MPRKSKISTFSFESKKKNPISLRDDELLDNDLKVIKVGEENTPLSLASGKVQLESDIFFKGDINTSINLTKIPELNIYHPSVTGGDVFQIKAEAVGTYLKAVISTIDIAGSGSLAHMYIEPEGQLYLTPSEERVIIPAETYLFFDGGTNTYITESADDILDFYVGAANMLKMTEDSLNLFEVKDSNLIVDAGFKLMLDGNTNEGSYIVESSDDTIDIYAGGVRMMTIAETSYDYILNRVDTHLTSGLKLAFDGDSVALSNTYILESSADILDFYVGADHMLSLDEANDKIIMAATNWVAGTVSGATVTEFSAANSAYAGMILGYTRLEGDLTNQGSFEIQNSITVEDSIHQITFKTPPSELVEIEATFYINFITTSTNINVGLSDNSTYNSVSAEFEYDAGGHPFSDGEAADGVFKVKFILKASHLEAVGTSQTLYVGFGTAGATKTAYLSYGVRASHGICHHPFVIKATALPATIYDGL